jgi:dimethylsulfone monooxygenase
MLGVPVLPHDERYLRSEEFLTTVKRSWTEDEFSFDGDYFTVKKH